MSGCTSVRVHMYGVIRHLLGAEESPQSVLVLPVPFTLGDVVHGLSDRYGERLEEAMVSGGYLQGYVKVFVDGEEARGALADVVGPTAAAGGRVDVYFVPVAEGG